MALAFPGVLVAVTYGQTSLIATALIGGALLCLERWPGLAGLLIGMLAFKPQLGLLIPAALVAGRHWRSILAAALTVAILAGISAALFGLAAWQEFLASFAVSRAVLEQGVLPYSKMGSAFAALRILGAGPSLAYAGQLASSLAALLAVILVWRSPARPKLKNAALVVCGLLATPYLLDYDLVLLALPIAWLAVDIVETDWLPLEQACLATVFFLPVAAAPFAEATGILRAPIVMTAFLAIILRRAGRESLSPAGPQPAIA